MRKDLNESLRYYKEGARKGNYYCYAGMAAVFGFTEQRENVQKAWRFYFIERSKTKPEVEEFPGKHSIEVAAYLVQCLRLDLPVEFQGECVSERQAVVEILRDQISLPQVTDKALHTQAISFLHDLGP